MQTITTRSTRNDLRGTFRIRFETETTYDISYEASADDVSSALKSLPTVGDVRVTRNENNPTYPHNGYRWVVTFLTNVGDVAQLEVSTDKRNYGYLAVNGSLVGTDASVSTSTTANGFDGFEQQTVTVSAASNDTVGTIAVIFDGATTSEVPWNITSYEMKEELDKLGNMGEIYVYREILGYGYRWTVVFITNLSKQPKLECSSGNLVGFSVSCTTTQTHPGRLPTFDSSSKNSTEILAHGRKSFTHTIKGLSPSVRYYVRVSAWNGVGSSFGDSQFSTPALLAPSRLADSPKVVSMSSVNNTAIKVEWSQPVYSHGIDGYKVQWDGNGGTNEVQTVKVSANSELSGTFKIAFDDQITFDIDYDASAESVVAAMNSLTTVGRIKASRTAGLRSFMWAITFVDNIGDLPLIVLDTTLLKGDGASGEVVETLQGSSPYFDQGSVGINVRPLGETLVHRTPEIQSILTIADADDLAGSFQVRFMGYDSVSIPFDASAEDMKYYLEGIKNVGKVNVERSDLVQSTITPLSRHGKRWDVTFLSAAGDMPSFLVSTSGALSWGVRQSGSSSSTSFGLTGTRPSVYVEEVQKGSNAPTEVVVNNLPTEKMVYSRVFSHNNHGYSPAKMSTYGLIPRNVLPSFPTNIKINTISGTRVGVSWEAPLSNGGDPITKYSVQWSRDSDFSGSSSVVKTAVVDVFSGSKLQNYTISGCSPNEKVFVRVLAYNRVGHGPSGTAHPVDSSWNEIQTILLRSNETSISSGKFRLEFGGVKTDKLDFESEAYEIQEALQKLENVGTVDVSRNQYGYVYSSFQSQSTIYKWNIEWTVTFTSNSGNLDSTANSGNVSTILITDVENGVSSAKSVATQSMATPLSIMIFLCTRGARENLERGRTLSNLLHMYEGDIGWKHNF